MPNSAKPLPALADGCDGCTYIQKSVGAISLLVPTVEALALPILSETRQRRSPRWYVYMATHYRMRPTRAVCNVGVPVYTHPNGRSLLLCRLTECLGTARFQPSSTKRQVNAFYI